MRNAILISVIIFTFWSCAPNDVTFDPKAKKEMMDSWAWKIFVFTDLAEVTPVDTTKNEFEGTSPLDSIFADDILGAFSDDDLFFASEKEAFKTPIIFSNINVAKRKE